LRFPGGTYMLWYPQLTRLEAHDLPPRLKRLPASRWLHVTLRVRTPAADGFGMHGSGLFVVNPPWTLQADAAGGDALSGQTFWGSMRAPGSRSTARRRKGMRAANSGLWRVISHLSV
jgi:hypothetical protein